MEIRYNSAARVQPIAYKTLLSPGECALCKRIGRVPDEIFADLGVEQDYYGFLYLCTDCCLELADFVGAKPVEQFREEEARSKEYYTLWLAAEKKVGYLRGLLNARIDSLVDSEPDSHGLNDVPIFETESSSDAINRILDKYKSKPA